MTSVMKKGLRGADRRDVRTGAGAAPCARTRALAVMLAWAASLAHAAETDPLLLIKQTTATLFAAVERERAVSGWDERRLQALVRDILAPHFDLERTCRWALGKHWHEATDAQRARIVEELRTVLVRTYAAGVEEFLTLALSYESLGGDEAAGDVLVSVEAERPAQAPLAVSFRLHRGAHGWKIYDVALGGVSLVKTYRTSFAYEIRRGGLDALIAALTARNRAGADDHSL